MFASHFRSLGVIITGSFLLTACMSFRAGELPPVEGWPPATSLPEGKSIGLVVTGHSIFGGQENRLPSTLMEAWTESAERIYRLSNLFSEVTIGVGETDLRAHIHLINEGNINLLAAFLTGLTLMTFPGRAADRFTVKTTFFTAQGERIGEVTKSETVTTWLQWALIVVLPFKPPGPVLIGTLEDLHRATLLEAHSLEMI